MSRDASAVIKQETRYRQNKILLDDYEDQTGKVGFCEHSKYLHREFDGKKQRKFVPCKQMICPVCGRTDSLAHLEKYWRGMRKILGVEKALGYFVVTFPPSCRDFFLKQYNLNQFRAFFQELIKTYPWYICWTGCFHWGGDKHKGWHPHYNMLVGQKIKGIPKKDLAEIKQKTLDWVCMNIAEVPAVVVDYSYKVGFKRMLHGWKYVCRPTMLLVGNDDLYGGRGVYSQMWNYRNIRWSRNWKKFEGDLGRGMEELERTDVKWIFGGDASDILEETLYFWNYLGKGIFETTDST